MGASVQSDEFLDVLADGLWIEVIKRGRTTTITPRGDWDLGAQRVTDQAIRDVLTDQPERLVLDLSGLSFIDSSGIHATLDLARRCLALNIRLTIVRGPRPVQRVFDVCQLTERLPFVTTSDGAG